MVSLIDGDQIFLCLAVSPPRVLVMRGSSPQESVVSMFLAGKSHLRRAHLESQVSGCVIGDVIFSWDTRDIHHTILTVCAMKAFAFLG